MAMALSFSRNVLIWAFFVSTAATHARRARAVSSACAACTSRSTPAQCFSRRATRDSSDRRRETKACFTAAGSPEKSKGGRGASRSWSRSFASESVVDDDDDFFSPEFLRPSAAASRGGVPAGSKFSRVSTDASDRETTPPREARFASRGSVRDGGGDREEADR